MSLVIIAREQVGTQSTQGTLTREHVRHEHVIMWPRRHARHIGTWAREHARHVGLWAGKHARHVGTWVRKDARHVATRARKASNLPDSVCSLLKEQFNNANIAKSFFNIIRVFWKDLASQKQIDEDLWFTNMTLCCSQNCVWTLLIKIFYQDTLILKIQRSYILNESFIANVEFGKGQSNLSNDNMMFLPMLLEAVSRDDYLWKICCKKVLQKFTGKHLCRNHFLNKVIDLQGAPLLKKRLWHRCFPVNFVKFVRKPILKSICERLLLICHLCSVVIILPKF